MLLQFFSAAFSRVLVLVVLVSGVVHLASAEQSEVTNPVQVLAEAVAGRPVTLAINGPSTSEQDADNPFLSYRAEVTFTGLGHQITVPAYYAADGSAADSGAEAGSVWRAHFIPPEAGNWEYRVSFRQGIDVAIAEDNSAGEPTACHGAAGTLRVADGESMQGPWTDGKVRYTRGRYLQHAISKKVYIKVGADSPENLLGYVDFDGTYKNPSAPKGKKNKPLHRYEPHLKDWKEGDPSWQDGKGKGLIGALTYLSSKGMNSVYFITMNVTGDGEDVWPWIAPDERDRFDCSKLDQWNRVFDHMDSRGLALHIIQQETENDKLLDGGDLGPQRKLYYRELIARFAHHWGVIWNLGEENVNTTEQQLAFAEYLKKLDPYRNPIVVHSYPDQKEKVFAPLLGAKNIDGPSLQFSADWEKMSGVVADWIRRSEQAGQAWYVAIDEPGTAARGVDPDSRKDNNQPRARKTALWGNLMAGGGGVEWYFGYKNPHNDLNCEDWRSRDRLWDQTRYAKEFFEQLPITEMKPSNTLVMSDAKGAQCLAKPGHTYAVHLPYGGSAKLNLSEASGEYILQWYNPRTGKFVDSGSLVSVSTGKQLDLGHPPTEPNGDWVVLLRSRDQSTGNASSLPKFKPRSVETVVVKVEAESFAKQSVDSTRRWYKVSRDSQPSGNMKDGDPAHVEGSGGGAYLEILPDTRRNHGHKLIPGENFTNKAGEMAVLDYSVKFDHPGRYYVWVRAYSTGSEDNGIHVGLNGEWPESGQRMQWCEGKHQWKWESRQRTKQQHCGVPHGIYLDVPKAGTHTVHFSMREDGFEFDQFLLTTDRAYVPSP